MFDLIEKTLKSTEVMDLLHGILTRDDTINYGTQEYDKNNLYLFLTTTDLIVKYIMVHRNDYALHNYIASLSSWVNQASSYKQIIVSSYYFIADSIVHRLQLPDYEHVENRRKILTFIYQNYIESGYYFYGFHPAFLEKMRIDGLVPNKNIFHRERLQKLASIFRKNGVDKRAFDRLERNLDSGITDSMVVAYLSALESPEYFADMVATGIQFNDPSKYDMYAYLRKDYKQVKKNVDTLMDSLSFREATRFEIFELLDKEWDYLKDKDDRPMISFIPRYALAKNSLSDFHQIMSQAKDDDLALSIAKILDSRDSNMHYFEDLPFSALTTIEFPSYQDLISHKPRIVQQKIPKEVSISLNISNQELESETDVKQVPATVVNSRGNISFFALFGLFLFTCGVTLIFILEFLR